MQEITQSKYQRDLNIYKQASRGQYAVDTPHCKKDTNIDLAKYYCRVAKAIAYRSTCIDKQVGCVITDEHNIIISTGYNGSPKDYPHCDAIGYCIKEKGGVCLAVHAEINAIMKCANIRDIRHIYLTLSPCLECLKVILNTGCTHIYYTELSKQSELWLDNGVRSQIQAKLYGTPPIVIKIDI